MEVASPQASSGAPKSLAGMMAVAREPGATSMQAPPRGVVPLEQVRSTHQQTWAGPPAWCSTTQLVGARVRRSGIEQLTDARPFLGLVGVQAAQSASSKMMGLTTERLPPRRTFGS